MLTLLEEPVLIPQGGIIVDSLVDFLEKFGWCLLVNRKRDMPLELPSLFQTLLLSDVGPRGGVIVRYGDKFLDL